MIVWLIAGLLAGSGAPVDAKIDARCYRDSVVHAWVYFQDKGVSPADRPQAIERARRGMSRSVVARRSLRGGVFDEADLPVTESYVDAVRSRGGVVLHRSRWLNAASFLLPRETLVEIAAFGFVREIVPVARHNAVEEVNTTVADSLAYGLTFRQSRMFGIERLHDEGIYGSGVRVGFLDTGLRRVHNAMRYIKVVAEYDFLSGDRLMLDSLALTERYGFVSSLVAHRHGPRIDLFFASEVVRDPPARDVLQVFSSDGGSTWSSVRNLTQNYNTWVGDLDVCGRDTAYLAFRDNGGVQVMTVDDSVLQQQYVAGKQCWEPTVALFLDTVVVGYVNGPYVLARKGGVSGYDAEFVIDSVPGNAQAPEAVAGLSGWGMLYGSFPDDSIYFTRFVGDTPTTVCLGAGSRPAAAASGDTLQAVWLENAGAAGTRLVHVRSTDFGATFASPVALAQDLDAIGAVSVCQQGNRVKVAWEDGGIIQYRISSDGGQTFSGLDSLPGVFRYEPCLLSDGSDIRLFCVERGDSSTDGYASTSSAYRHPRHGTEMAGIVAGYSYNNYIGVAPGVEVLVAKTENPDSVYEFPVEEDAYIAGLEWMEEHGADIVSSSLGYSRWYQWPDDYDGRTAPTSIAAYEATRRGIVMVTASGNVSAPQLVVPGDAMGTITVGGIDTLYSRWQYSGYGPTFDGRRKPEIVCLSAAPVVVDPDSANSYLYSFGTSGATAMAAGICALLLEGHPNWNADSVRAALCATASHADAPSDSIGFGWPDAYAAFYYTAPDTLTLGPGGVFLVPYPNPLVMSDHPGTYLPFKLDTGSAVEMRVYSISGKMIRKIERAGLLTPGRYESRDQSSPSAAFFWDGRDSSGDAVGSGVYYCVLITHGGGNDVTKVTVVR